MAKKYTLKKNKDIGILPQTVNFSFTPSDLARDLYFYPTWCGHYYCNSNYFKMRAAYQYLLLFYVCEGRFHIEYRHSAIDAEKGDVILMDCTEPHYYHAHDGLEFLYLHFDGSNSHEICRHILEQNGFLIRHTYNQQIGRELNDMIEIYKNGGYESAFQSSMRIYRLFEYLLASGQQVKQGNEIVKQATHYINDHLTENLTLEEIAASVHLSPYYFAHYFKETTGFSPWEYVINTRLNRAKAALQSTTKSVEEIAWEVGYTSSRSLINMFTKKMGVSPAKWRKNYDCLVSEEQEPEEASVSQYFTDPDKI